MISLSFSSTVGRLGGICFATLLEARLPDCFDLILIFVEFACFSLTFPSFAFAADVLENGLRAALLEASVMGMELRIAGEIDDLAGEGRRSWIVPRYFSILNVIRSRAFSKIEESHPRRGHRSRQVGQSTTSPM